MGTNVKINIFEAHPVTSANNIILSMTVSTNIIYYLFSKIKTVGGCYFLMKTCTIFITIHGFAFSFCQVFVTNVAFVTFLSLGIINNSSQNSCSLLSNITTFGE